MSAIADALAFVTQGTGAELELLDPGNRPKTGETGPNPRP
jgi:hypothetical protein